MGDDYKETLSSRHSRAAAGVKFLQLQQHALDLCKPKLKRSWTHGLSTPSHGTIVAIVLLGEGGLVFFKRLALDKPATFQGKTTHLRIVGLHNLAFRREVGWDGKEGMGVDLGRMDMVNLTESCKRLMKYFEQ